MHVHVHLICGFACAVVRKRLLRRIFRFVHNAREDVEPFPLVEHHVSLRNSKSTQVGFALGVPFSFFGKDRG